MDLLYPYIPKWVQSAKALRSYEVIKTCQTWKLWFFAKNRRKFKISLWKFWISEFHRVFCLYKRKMVIPICSVSFSIIVCRYFSQWWITNWKRLHPPPLTLWLWQLTLPPGKVVTPIFFRKMTAKDVKEITYMPLETFFSVLERPWAVSNVIGGQILWQIRVLRQILPWKQPVSFQIWKEKFRYAQP